MGHRKLSLAVQGVFLFCVFFRFVAKDMDDCMTWALFPRTERTVSLLHEFNYPKLE